MTSNESTPVWHETASRDGNDPESVILMNAALRFDGYRCMQSIGYDPLKPSELRRCATLRLPKNLLHRFCLYFHTQRSIARCDYLEKDGQVWRLYRTLFLNLARKEFPADCTHNVDNYDLHWRRFYKPHLDEIILWVQNIHNATTYRDEP